MQSALDTIPGVGPKRKKALLRKFGSVRGIREASVEEIAVHRRLHVRARGESEGADLIARSALLRALRPRFRRFAQRSTR